MESSQPGFKKWAGFLWPFGGTLLGLVAMPVAIAQYPDFFNQNRWLLPASVAAVIACWLIPFFLHERVQRSYRFVCSLSGTGRAVTMVVSIVVLTFLWIGFTRLLNFHERHLTAVLTKNSYASTNAPSPAPLQVNPTVSESRPKAVPSSVPVIKPPAIKISTKSPVSVADGDPLTLKKLFDTDFNRPNWFRANHPDMNMTMTNDSPQYPNQTFPFSSTVVQDYEARSEFLAVYIPAQIVIPKLLLLRPSLFVSE